MDDNVPETFSFSAAQVLRTTDEWRKNGGKVVQTGENPSIVLKNVGSECKHPKYVIDAETRSVQCDTCLAVIDAFDALLTIAKAEQRMQFQYEEMQKEEKMRRGFYEQKKSLKALRCRHKHTYQIKDKGILKCLLCDTTVRQDEVRSDESKRSPYGYCPVCGMPTVFRERRLNGNDKCANGHEYPSREAKP